MIESESKREIVVKKTYEKPVVQKREKLGLVTAAGGTGKPN